MFRYTLAQHLCMLILSVSVTLQFFNLICNVNSEYCRHWSLNVCVHACNLCVRTGVVVVVVVVMVCVSAQTCIPFKRKLHFRAKILCMMSSLLLLMKNFTTVLCKSYFIFKYCGVLYIKTVFLFVWHYFICVCAKDLPWQQMPSRRHLSIETSHICTELEAFPSLSCLF